MNKGFLKALFSKVIGHQTAEANLFQKGGKKEGTREGVLKSEILY